MNWHGNYSSALTDSNGVPQGLVLGPLLFIIAIINLYYRVSGKTILFADDMTLYSSHRKYCDVEKSIKNIISIYSQWFIGKRLALKLPMNH